jgi:hypothetical protein
MTSMGQAVSAALIQFVWQGAVVALLFWILLAMLGRRSAQARYMVGCVALGILAFLPVVTGYLIYRPAAPSGNQPVRDWLPLWVAGVLVFSCRPVPLTSQR